MVRNFFKVAIRNFLRQGFYSVINVVGLSTGLACALLIYLWITDETSKNKFHHDIERIYLIAANLKLSNGEVVTWTNTPGPVATDLIENSPDVELAVRTTNSGRQLLQGKDQGFYEQGLYADPTFFKLFSFKIVEGNASVDTTKADWICVSRSVANKLFPGERSVGKTIRINNSREHEIIAVFEDVGTESSLKFQLVLPYVVYEKQRGQFYSWGNFDNAIYVKLADPKSREKVLAELQVRADKINSGQGGGAPVKYLFLPFGNHYLHSRFENGQIAGGRIEYVRIFAVVGIFILVIAAINFTNMATARATSRGKEVGIRKVVGAQRKSLFYQFVGESTLVCAISMIISIGLVYLILPAFNTMVAKEIQIPAEDQTFILSVIGLAGVMGLMSGAYPAMFLSSYQPAQILKGVGVQKHGGSSLRRTLVVFQFCITVILISSSVIVYQQIEYIFNKNVGYERDAVLSFTLRGSLPQNFESFRNEALRIPGVTSIGKSDNSLVQVTNQNGSLGWPGKSEDDDLLVRTVCVDYGFLETMGVKLLDGRLFKKEFNDTSAFVLTRKAVEAIGLKEPIGATLTQWGKEGKVVGVVDDIHSRSLHTDIDPVVFMFRPEWAFSGFVKIDPRRTQEAIKSLEELHKKFVPEYPFAYTFLDADFARLYTNEKVVSSLAIGFTIIAIIISGLGILGLAAYTAERKRKEIGIRKTMGASIRSIIALISRDFLKLTMIAAVLGCPVAYYIMERYLSGYSYHTDISWLVFFVTTIFILVITLLIILLQVWRAAKTNPSEVLRNE